MHASRVALLSAAFVVSAALVGCSSAAGQSQTPTSAPTVRPSQFADTPVTGAPGGGAIGGPGNGGPIGGPGNPTLVSPRPGLTNVHDVQASGVTAAVDGRHVTAQVTWTSGVEPCYSLADVKVARDGNRFVLTVQEGSADSNAMCIEIAMFKAARVDLGELEPGSYTISATGEAPPITVVVS